MAHQIPTGNSHQCNPGEKSWYGRALTPHVSKNRLPLCIVPEILTQTRRSSADSD